VPIFEEYDPLAYRRKIVASDLDRRVQVRPKQLLVGPKVDSFSPRRICALGNTGTPSSVPNAADVVGVGMRTYDGVNRPWINSCRLQAGLKTTGMRPKHLEQANSGFEQNSFPTRRE